MNANNDWGRPRHHYFGWAILAFAVLAAVSIGLFTYFARPMGYPGYYYPFPFFFFPFGWIFVFFIIFWAVRWLFWPRRWGYRGYWGYGWGYGGDEYYILRQRYARG